MSEYYPICKQYPISAIGGSTITTTPVSISALLVTNSGATLETPVLIRKWGFRTDVANAGNVLVYLNGNLQDTVAAGFQWSPIYDESPFWFDSSLWTLKADTGTAVIYGSASK